jgi:phospholipid/cholesterol/gamma-HCH transport system substrate-binding protein
MKKENSMRWKLGLFVFTGLALFTLAIYLLGSRQHLFGSTFRINCVFNDVGGLQVGNNVRFSGISVGTVENVLIIRDTSVLVTMLLDGAVKKHIRKDSKAIIGSDGLMGDKLINITPGKGTPIRDDDNIKGVKTVEFDEILSNLKETTENAAVITADLADIMENIHEGRGTVGALLMDSTFADNFRETLRNVKAGTSGFQENMEAAKSSVLLRGYFKRKQRREKERQEKQKEQQNKSKD